MNKETIFALYIKDMRRLCEIPPEDRKKAYEEACKSLGIPESAMQSNKIKIKKEEVKNNEQKTKAVSQNNLQ